MPSSRKQYEYQFDVDYDFDDTYTSNSSCPLMCERCDVHYANGELCSTCIYNENVEKHGIPDFKNEYWMKSCCETGQRLRRQYENLHIIDSDVQYKDIPYPVYLPSLKELPAQDICGFITLYKKHYLQIKTPLIKPQPNKTWETPL